MATGPGSGVWVLDVDGEQGRTSLAEQEAGHGPLPATLASRTGREDGGEHRWFTWPVDFNIRNSASKLAPGLDVRGDGGYVVIPPSVHPSGADYHWAIPEASIADAPDWLLKLVIASTVVRARTPAVEIGILREGHRNDGLTRLGGSLRRINSTQSEIERELLAANTRRCVPPLADSEVLKIAASVAKYPPGGPDPLESAWQVSSSVAFPSKYARFLGLTRCLQLARPGQLIALPLERIGILMHCDWTQVRRWRKRAVDEGWIRLMVPYVPNRRAAQFLFVECPTRATVPLGRAYH
jgi:hypothetical protein